MIGERAGQEAARITCAQCALDDRVEIGTQLLGYRVVRDAVQ
jgi:hypothetical protein